VLTQTGLTSLAANVRLRLSEVPNNGITNPSAVTVYRRSTVGSGVFTPLATSVVTDPITNGAELQVGVNGFSEFVLGSSTQGLPVALSAFSAE
jgi:hypothetical protein